MMIRCSILVIVSALSVLMVFSPECRALEPAEVLVVANPNATGSIRLSEYYREKRKIPKQNFLKVWVTDRETCSRYDYDRKVAKPVRRYIEQMKTAMRVRCVVLMYGIPLKVNAPEMSDAEEETLRALEQKLENLTRQLNEFADKESEFYRKKEKEIGGIQKRITALKRRHREKGASLDSEIALVLADGYDLSGWMPNPYYIGFKNQEPVFDRDKVLMVSRLDGPAPETVRRMIDDTLFAEEKGLTGNAYFDARWKKPEKRKKSGYGFYDQSIHDTADLLKKSGLLPVTLDDQSALFQPGDCPDAALYCGWYSLARYVDAFDWVRGAVGYHIASGECTTLKREGSRVWCKRMLEDGVAATLGPVSEPYVQAFPVPAVFFSLLADGYLNLAECYMVSLPFLSWQMVLVGDPLYRPFKSTVENR